MSVVVAVPELRVTSMIISGRILVASIIVMLGRV
jgi:hypothetical protein